MIVCFLGINSSFCFGKSSRVMHFGGFLLGADGLSGSCLFQRWSHGEGLDRGFCPLCEIPLSLRSSMLQATNYYKLFITWMNEKVQKTFVERNMFEYKHIRVWLLYSYSLYRMLVLTVMFCYRHSKEHLQTILVLWLFLLHRECYMLAYPCSCSKNGRLIQKTW